MYIASPLSHCPQEINLEDTGPGILEYQVRDLFLWQMLTKMVISYLLDVEKNATQGK